MPSNVELVQEVGQLKEYFEEVLLHIDQFATSLHEEIGYIKNNLNIPAKGQPFAMIALKEDPKEVLKKVESCTDHHHIFFRLNFQWFDGDDPTGKAFNVE